MGDDADWECRICTFINSADRRRCEVCGRGPKGQPPPSDLEKMKKRCPTPADFIKTSRGPIGNVFTKSRWCKTDDVISVLDEVKPPSQFAKFCEYPTKHLKHITETIDVDINAQDERGNTILIAACQNRRVKDLDGSKQCALVKELIQRKADVNMRNVEGHTALHMCHKFKYQETADLLEAKGAKDTIRDFKGHTPKEHAKHIHDIHAAQEAAYEEKMQKLTQARIAVRQAARIASRPQSAASVKSNKSRPQSAASTISQISEKSS